MKISGKSIINKITLELFIRKKNSCNSFLRTETLGEKNVDINNYCFFRN